LYLFAPHLVGAGVGVSIGGVTRLGLFIVPSKVLTHDEHAAAPFDAVLF
jgi:hypothetical protein